MNLEKSPFENSEYQPSDYVFILYYSDQFTEDNEAGRMYPHTEEDYFDCQEDAQERGNFMVLLRKNVGAYYQQQAKA